MSHGTRIDDTFGSASLPDGTNVIYDRGGRLNSFLTYFDGNLNGVSAFFRTSTTADIVLYKDNVPYKTLPAQSFPFIYSSIYAADSSYKFRPDNLIQKLIDGLSAHYNGEYDKSEIYFGDAEMVIDASFTKSISRVVGASVIDENITDYKALKYEVVALHIFRALNYLFLNNIDDAAVEARKINMIFDEHKRLVNFKFSDEDAFAQYLSALILKKAHLDDDARICFDAAKRMYSFNGFELPSVQFDLGQDHSMGKLILLHYAGYSPRRAHTNAFTSPNFVIKNFRAFTIDTESQGYLSVDFAKSAVNSMRDRSLVLTTRASIRTIYQGGMSVLTKQNQFIANEDLRCWNNLPSRINMGQLVLQPGYHTVYISFLDANNNVISKQKLQNIEIRKGETKFVAVRTTF